MHTPCKHTDLKSKFLYYIQIHSHIDAYSLFYMNEFGGHVMTEKSDGHYEY